MFSFDGDFRRKPMQNLGGSSDRKSDRTSLIKNAQIERQKRERNRREMQSSTKIQAYVRSFIQRQQRKGEERVKFDEYLKRFGMGTDEHLEFLLKRLVFFYDFHQDGDRIILLCQNILKNPKCLYSKVTEAIWCYRLKRLLNWCMVQIFSESHASAIPLRMLEVFTDCDNVVKYIHNPYVVQQYLEVVFKFMIEQKYFRRLRNFITDRIPILDEEDNYHSAIGEAILQMVMRPLRLIEMSGDALQEKILSSFACQMLSIEYSSQIRYFIIPELSKQANFPFVQLLEMLMRVRQREIDYKKTILIDIEPQQVPEETPVFSSSLLHSVLTFDRLIISRKSHLNSTDTVYSTPVFF